MEIKNPRPSGRGDVRMGILRRTGWFRHRPEHRDAYYKGQRKKALARRQFLGHGEKRPALRMDEIHQRTTRPMIGRVGGKTKIAGKIVDKISPHRVYCEPFVGGGSVFFKKEPAEVEVINDKDKDIAGFYKGIKKIDQKDLEKIDMTPSRERYNKMLDVKPKTPEQQVEKTLYLNKRSYSGKMGKGDYAPSMEKGKERGGIKTIIEKFPLYQQRLKNVKVHNQDFKPVIEQYDSKNTFFYLDPPYYNVHKNAYIHEDVTPAEVHDAVDGIKGKFLLSYNNIPEVRDEFKDYNIKKINTTYELRGGDNKQPVTELLISNYKI